MSRQEKLKPPSNQPIAMQWWHVGRPTESNDRPNFHLYDSPNPAGHISLPVPSNFSFVTTTTDSSRLLTFWSGHPSISNNLKCLDQLSASCALRRAPARPLAPCAM